MGGQSFLRLFLKIANGLDCSLMTSVRILLAEKSLFFFSRGLSQGPRFRLTYLAPFFFNFLSIMSFGQTEMLACLFLSVCIPSQNVAKLLSTETKCPIQCFVCNRFLVLTC